MLLPATSKGSVCVKSKLKHVSFAVPNFVLWRDAEDYDIILCMAIHQDVNPLCFNFH
jgi:hypothetical protein